MGFLMEFRFTKHALERSFQRQISPEQCKRIFYEGKVIEKYPDDKPFPSELRVAKIDERFLHLVTSQDGSIIHVITAYVPDITQWESGFEIRKKL